MIKMKKNVCRAVFYVFVISWLASVSSCGSNPAEIRVGALRHFDRANTLMSQQKPKDAISEYQMAIRLNDKQPEFFYNMGLAYYQLVLYELAVESYQAAIELNSNFAEAWYNLSLAYNQLGQTEDAFMAHDRYLTLNKNVVPHPPEPQLN